eukprot:TRINITY_DN1553_c5_g1_i1.p1 TRINITY_DN1553_c5_g1~~TRINITY_DN1553_c5_g1_i1.p1  ORF type:complete len:231 (+),score=63.76 TRINITY_DN1553_c5_g1_i1:83-694(+)
MDSPHSNTYHDKEYLRHHRMHEVMNDLVRDLEGLRPEAPAGFVKEWLKRNESKYAPPVVPGNKTRVTARQPTVDEPREQLLAMTAPGVVTDHEQALEAAQRITAARYKHYRETSRLYPAVYPPPPAGDGTDVFKAADEGGEGLVTRKEIAKYLMRNQTLRHRLREGWAKFNSNFGTEDTPENHEELTLERFKALWQEAAALRQ